MAEAASCFVSPAKTPIRSPVLELRNVWNDTAKKDRESFALERGDRGLFDHDDPSTSVSGSPQPETDNKVPVHEFASID